MENKDYTNLVELVYSLNHSVAVLVEIFQSFYLNSSNSEKLDLVRKSLKENSRLLNKLYIEASKEGE